MPDKAGRAWAAQALCNAGCELRAARCERQEGLCVLVRDGRCGVRAVTVGGGKLSGVAGGCRVSQQRCEGTRAKCRRAEVTSSEPLRWSRDGSVAVIRRRLRLAPANTGAAWLQTGQSVSTEQARSGQDERLSGRESAGRDRQTGRQAVAMRLSTMRRRDYETTRLWNWRQQT